MPQVQVIQPIQQQPKRLRVAAYARVSTKSNEQLHSMSVQTEYYEDLIQKNPNWEFVGVYADEGISGTSIKHRAELNRLMEDCRAGMIDRILVKSASISQSCADMMKLLSISLPHISSSSSPPNSMYTLRWKLAFWKYPSTYQLARMTTIVFTRTFN